MTPSSESDSKHHAITQAGHRRAYWLAWLQIPRIGPRLVQRLQQEFGDLETAWLAKTAQLAQVEGFGPKLLASVNQVRAEIDPQALLEEYQRANPRFLTPEDDDYPVLLQQTYGPPPLLHYAGQLDPGEMRGEKPAIAIVGTRSPSEYGRRWTRRLSRALAQQGFTIVSGLAHGIDAEAHRACLAVGGRTIAVLGTGVDVVYPAKNRQLYRDILQQGLILSEYPAGTQPDRSHFPQRNRIVAGFCRATIVVEAPQRSGALITAYGANEFCRDVYVVPGTLDNPNARGCLELIGQGAQVILDEAHLLEMLGCMPQLAADRTTADRTTADRTPAESIPTVSTTPVATVAPSSSLPPQLPPPLACLWAAVGAEPCSFDHVVMRSQLDVGAVSSGLLQLELMGLIAELPGKQYQRC